MEPQRAIAVLAELGKAVRLFRLYAPTHPSVQRVLSDLGQALPGLARVGTVEVQITPQGFESGGEVLGAKVEQLRDLSQLLYSLGHRYLVIEPGLTLDDAVSLVRALVASLSSAARRSGAIQRLPELQHFRLMASRPASGQEGAAELTEEEPSFTRRSTGVFEPDALPPEIEARRLIETLRTTPEEFQLAGVARLDVLAQQLATERDFGTLAEIVAALNALAAESTDRLVRQAITHTVEDLATPPSAAGVIARLSNPGLSRSDREPLVVAAASFGEKALNIVLDAYLSATDPQVRAACAEVATRAAATAISVLRNRITEDRRETRKASAALLGATGSPDAVPLLVTLLADADPSVRVAGVEALARLRCKEGCRPVLSALHDEDATVRTAAAAAIAECGDPSAAPVVISRLQGEQDDDAACALAAAAGTFKAEAAVPRLAELAEAVSGVFQRRAPRVRVAAIDALGAIGTPEAQAEIARHRHDPVPEIRAAVQQALG